MFPDSLRLFTCLRFSPQTRAALFGAAEKLRAFSTGGNFSAEENYHLTLTFLGQTQCALLGPIQKALTESTESLSPFTLTLRGLGSFDGQTGLVLWAGAAPSPELTRLYEAQRQAFLALGLTGANETRPFRPHLTLARNARFPAGFGAVKNEITFGPLAEPVTRLSLMKSERTGGRLVYTELFAAPLACKTEST